MTEKQTKLTPVKVTMDCDCGGEMVPTGIVKLSYPELYVHQCSHCGIKVDYHQTYPYIKYE